MKELSHLAFEITDRCNLDCVYCYNVWKMDGAVRVPFNSYKKAVKTLNEIFRQANIKSVALLISSGFCPVFLRRICLIHHYFLNLGDYFVCISTKSNFKYYEKQSCKNFIPVFFVFGR